MLDRGRNIERLPGGTSTPTAFPSSPSAPDSEGRSAFKRLEESGKKLGIAQLSLNRIFDRMERRSLEELQRRFARVQWERVAHCGRLRIRDYESVAAESPILEFPPKILETALILKPVDTLELALEQNQSISTIRETLGIIRSNLPVTENLVYKKPLVAETVVLFRQIIEADVSLILSNTASEREQFIQETVGWGQACFTRMQNMYFDAQRNPKMQGERVVPLRERVLDGQQRITKSNIKQFIASSAHPRRGKRR